MTHTETQRVVEMHENKFLREIAATLEEVSSCLDNYADVDDGDEGQPEANAALRQKCAVDEILGRFPKARDETFLVGDRALHEFIPDTCSHGVIEWNPPIGQGYAAWVGEGKITHRHSHPTNPLVALAAAIIKQRDARITRQQEEIERLRKLVQWKPEFHVEAPEQETLAIKFCLDIAGKKGDRGNPPDPVRLLEMAEALYLAEFNHFHRAALQAKPDEGVNETFTLSDEAKP